MRDNGQLESDIATLLADEQYVGQPLREALASLFGRYQNHLTQIERLTSISDGYQTVMRERNRSITERYDRQLRQLKKIVHISDQYQQALQEKNETLKEFSLRDALTGLANRRLMMERLNSEVAQAERRQTPFSLALVDIDHFKKINDQYGHNAGDAALVDIGQTLHQGLRGYDLCARWGGEEFLLLMADTSGQNAVEVAVRLRRMIHELTHPGLPAGVRPTVSMGIAEYRFDTPFSETIKRADEALYQAKNTGRDRIVLSP